MYNILIQTDLSKKKNLLLYLIFNLIIKVINKKTLKINFQSFYILKK